MARAGAHLSAGRLAEAEGVYRAVLNIDPEEFRAHLGLADCATGDGRVDDAIELLSEGSQTYAEAGSMRPAFALITKALAIAPSRLDLHIDVAELEAADGRAEMAALRLENLARTYLAAGQEEEAELVLEAAAAFLAEPEPAPQQQPAARAFVNPHTGHATPPPAPRVAASPPPPPPTTRATVMPKPLQPTPIHDMVRPSPLLAKAPPAPPAPPKQTTLVAARKAKRSSRGVAKTVAPKWCPSTVTSEPPPRAKKAVRTPQPSADPTSTLRRTVAPAPRPRKQPKAAASAAKKRPSIAPAPSPKRGGKKLDKLPPLRLAANRLRGAAARVRRGPSEEDRTTMWQRPTPTPA